MGCSSIIAAICVPARDEAASLPHLLDALARQRGAPPFLLCLLLDGCRDASAAIVTRAAPRLPYPVHVEIAASDAPNAGLARRRAMAAGLARIGGAGAMIVSSDADTVPAPDWLAATTAALAVADVAAGRPTRGAGPPSPVQDRVEAYLDTLHLLRRTIDPVPWEGAATHHYTSAASLAFRADAYCATGGFECVGAGEDGRIVDTAQRLGLRVRRDVAIRVETSARRIGRASGGLADHLRRLDRKAGEPVVAHPADVAWRYRGHAAARAAWSDLSGKRGALALALGCAPAHIDRVAADVANAEAFATRVVPDIPGGERMVALSVAEAALAHLRAPAAPIAACAATAA